MENIISNPGLHHLAENVFWILDAEDLKNCAQINQSCKTNFAKSNILFEEIRTSFKGEPKQLDQNYSISEEFF